MQHACSARVPTGVRTQGWWSKGEHGAESHWPHLCLLLILAAQGVHGLWLIVKRQPAHERPGKGPARMCMCVRVALTWPP